MAGGRPFRIVIASHGDLAAAMLESASMICGTIEDATPVCLRPEHSPEGYAEELLAAIGDGEVPVLLLLDLQGGTPYNVASLISRRREGKGAQIYCICGVNLGMLLEAVTSIEILDAESVGRLVTAGRESVVDTTRYPQKASI
jgi:mannose/fructose-specific phosphotransferase system component IIA